MRTCSSENWPEFSLEILEEGGRVEAGEIFAMLATCSPGVEEASSPDMSES